MEACEDFINVSSEFISTLSEQEISSRVLNTIPKASCGRRSMKLVRLDRDLKSGFGMVITCGNTYDTVLHGAFVEAVQPGSPAALNGNIGPGDQIVSVNGTDVQSDHFLTVVDLLQSSPNSVNLIIAKPTENDFVTKGILEKPCVKTKTWIVGKEVTPITMPSINKISDTPRIDDTPIPKPRKKFADQERSSSFDVPDLTLNHSPNNGNGIWKNGESHVTRDNIPDIIASQMKHIISSVSSEAGDESETNLESDNYYPKTESDNENALLPGEVFHVVLDKKGGSLGLNIYQGTESSFTDHKHIYIHSIIPNGAADLDGRIKTGDKLVEVNGVLLENLSYEEVIMKLRESPQVAHLVLERGSFFRSLQVRNESGNSLLTKNKDSTSTKYSEHTNQNKVDVKRRQSSASVQATTNKDSECSDQFSYSSLPTVSNDADSAFYSAKDINSSSISYESEVLNTTGSASSQFSFSPKSVESKRTSPVNAKAPNVTPPGFRATLSSYSSTPNLADNSDEDDKKDSSHVLYRNKSIDCLSTPHCLQHHQGLIDFYQSYVRDMAGSMNQMPAVPIRKKKLKKLEDIYNYSNPDNTFQVCIQKSSRGLGISIWGGADTSNRDPFSQLIRIRKLYPLQPALECGKLKLGDVILEVNGTNMVGLTNTEALEVLRSAPTNVVMEVFRPSKSLIPTYIVKGVWPFVDSSSSSASSSLSRTDLNTYNVETGEFEIILVKRGGSLGFTIFRKDSSTEKDQDGIYVKALVREPAITDGRIQPGDRIIQVNGTDMSSMSHTEAIEFIRHTPNTVAIKLHRTDPPITPGYIEDHSVSKALRWEAVGFLHDRLKQKDSGDDSSNPKRKIKRKLERSSNAPSTVSTESESSNSSSGQDHTIEETTEDACDSSEHLSLEGSGLQRNQRPKSLDALNSSDRKRCPAFTDEESFHRQSSVMCSAVESKMQQATESEGVVKTTGKNLLKWRGSTLPHTEEDIQEISGVDPGDVSNMLSTFNENDTLVDSGSDEEKPVPYPRTTSFVNEWVNTFDVVLDRGWHGRLGFSLFDPPTEPAGSTRNMLPKAVEVKAVYPNSLAEKDDRIRAGDRLLEMNGECLLGKPAREVIESLRRTRGHIRMVFCRIEKRI